MPKKTGWRNPAIKWVMKQRNSWEGSTTTCGLFSIQTRLEKRRTSFHELFCDSNRTLKKRLKVSSLVPSKRPLQTAKTAGLHSSVPRSLAQRSSRARTHRRQAQPGRLYRSLQNITMSNAVASLSSDFGKWILVCNFFDHNIWISNYRKSYRHTFALHQMWKNEGCMFQYLRLSSNRDGRVDMFVMKPLLHSSILSVC